MRALLSGGMRKFSANRRPIKEEASQECPRDLNEKINSGRKATGKKWRVASQAGEACGGFTPSH